jgi:hypothetical protein
MDRTTQEKIIALAEKVKNPPSWWWKVLGGLIFLVMVIWLRYLLVKRSEELARLKTEATNKKLAAQQAALLAKVETDVNKRAIAEAAARSALKAAREDEDKIIALEANHLTNIAQLQAVADKDWTALNKLAGVKVPEKHDPMETLK